MTSRDWSKVFEAASTAPPASEEELRKFCESVCAPLSADEVAEVNSTQENPFPADDPLHDAWRPFDPAGWLLPQRPLPADYLDFLRWSNGGTFSNGDRHFVPLYGTHHVRQFLLAYHIPEYLPGAVPFGWDGSEQFYVFDMRQEAVNGEYPIWFVNAGRLEWPAALLLGTSFVDVCRDGTDPVSLARRSEA